MTPQSNVPHCVTITRRWPLWRVDGAQHHERVLGSGRWFWHYRSALDFARLVARSNRDFGTSTEIRAGTLTETYKG